MRRQLLLSVCVIVYLQSGVISQDELNRDRPCEHPNAINLPGDKKCLVPIRSSYTWDYAASVCERARGSLFQVVLSFSVSLECGSIQWQAVNQVASCSGIRPPMEDSHNVTSETLSVDYCVKTCHDRGARYTIYYNNTRSLVCYCNHALDQTYMGGCPRNTVDTNSRSTNFILVSKPDSLIQIASTNTTSRSEILCATVDSETLSTRRYITTEKCFNPHNFICDLGEESNCMNRNCQNAECYFILRQRCMLRVSQRSYHWYAARAYCQSLRGDLWNMAQLSDLANVPMPDRVKYWIGATNYDWEFNTTSASLGSVPNKDYNRVRCGHMVRVGSAASEMTFQWSDTVCDQNKASLCQFGKTDFKPEEFQMEAVCPWPTPPPPVAISTASTSNGAPVTNPPGPNPSAGSTLPTNSPGPQPSTGPIVSTSGDDTSFPIGAVIAAIIAGLILLACFVLLLAFLSRRKWMAGRFKKVREHLAFIPYFADVSGTDYESHANMSSFSDHGSQVGLVKGAYHNGASGYGMSTSYGEQSGAFSSKSLDRRHKETLDRKLAESQNYLISGNTSMDERGFSSTYNTLANRPRDVMTLQAHMDIKEDAELASLRASFRNRPEVALVTDNVDMNFTVNHAVSRSLSHAGSELSRSSLERTMEEINLPTSEGGMGLNLPERVTEEARIYSTMINNYNM